MSRKALKPEDFKIHIDSIYSFLESEKKYSQIRKFNSRFIHIKDTLLERKIILEKIIGNTNFYISNKDYVFFPKDYEYLLKQYQLKIRQANKKFFDNFVNKVNKKQLAPPPFINISTDEKLNDLEKQNNKLLSEYKELESKYKKQVEEHAKRFDELVARNNLNVTEYSNFINEKLIEIADLKNKLLKENKIVCYKIFGITIFKVTTNKRN